MADDFKLLDEPYDIDIAGGDFYVETGRAEVLQAVTQRLLVIRGEWEYDFTFGVPWTDGMFQVDYPQVRKEAHIKETILQTPNVNSVEQVIFSKDPINKGGYVAYQATTTYGPIEGELEV